MRRFVVNLPKRFSTDEVIRFWLHPVTRPHMRLYSNLDAEILQIAMGSCVAAIKQSPRVVGSTHLKFGAYMATCAAGMGYQLDQISEPLRILFRMFYLHWRLTNDVWEMVRSVKSYIDVVSFDEVRDNGEIDVLKSVGFSPPTFPLALSLRSLEHNQIELIFRRYNG